MTILRKSDFLKIKKYDFLYHSLSCFNCEWVSAFEKRLGANSIFES